MATGITITQIIHDLQKRSSYVTMVWDGQPEKRSAFPSLTRQSSKM